MASERENDGEPRGPWHVYVLRTAGRSLYTGIALDVERRLSEHDAGSGAKCLRGRGPLELVYRCALGPRGLALRAEHALKRLPRADKERLVAECPDGAALLDRLGLDTRTT